MDEKVVPPLKVELRIDKWLWFARFAKTRGQAQRLIEAGEVSVNGLAVTKPNAMVRIGDAVVLPRGRSRRLVRVLGLGERRTGAKEAGRLYQEENDGAIVDVVSPSRLMLGRTMLDHILSFVFGEDAVQRQGADGARLAVAALMVEAAQVDGDFAKSEHERIRSLLINRFEVAPAEVDDLVERAIDLQQRTSQLFPQTKAIVDQFSLAQRIELMETLWEIVYADGRLHDYEASLVRRIAGLLYIPDQDSGAARLRAMARLGISDTPLA